MMDDRWYGHPPPPQQAKSKHGGLKIFAGLVVLAFGMTLAVLIGNRLSDEALAVLAGAVCGVGAAIPISLLIVAVSQRRAENGREKRPAQPAMTPPTVFVVPPTALPMQQSNMTPPAMWDHQPAVRRFTIMGDDGPE